MTTIVAARQGSLCVIGADRALTCGTTRTLSEPKVVLRPGRIVHAMAGLVEGETKALRILEAEPLAYALACKRGRVACLFYADGLWHADTHGCVTPVQDFETEGSGADVAAGAMLALAGRVGDLRERVLIALRAAARRDTSTAGPFDIVSIWPTRRKVVQYEP